MRRKKYRCGLGESAEIWPRFLRASLRATHAGTRFKESDSHHIPHSLRESALGNLHDTRYRNRHFSERQIKYREQAMASIFLCDCASRIALATRSEGGVVLNSQPGDLISCRQYVVSSSSGSKRRKLPESHCSPYGIPIECLLPPMWSFQGDFNHALPHPTNGSASEPTSLSLLPHYTSLSLVESTLLWQQAWMPLGHCCISVCRVPSVTLRAHDHPTRWARGSSQPLSPYRNLDRGFRSPGRCPCTFSSSQLSKP